MVCYCTGVLHYSTTVLDSWEHIFKTCLAGQYKAIKCNSRICTINSVNCDLMHVCVFG